MERKIIRILLSLTFVMLYATCAFGASAEIQNLQALKTGATVDISIPVEYDYGEIEYTTADGTVIKRFDDGKEITLDGMDPQTTYNVTVRYYKDGIVSDDTVFSFTTTGETPGFESRFSKKLLKKMRKGKNFKINLPYRMSRPDVRTYLGNLMLRNPRCNMYDYYVYPDKENAVVAIKPVINKTKKTRLEAALKQAEKIAKEARKKKTKKAMVKYVNARICKMCKYDYKAYRSQKKLGRVNEKYRPSYTAYGCLVRKTATCAGYTAAFTLIMEKLGIPEKGVYNQTHCWNRVKIDKKWYVVDVTWNDTSKSNKYLLVSRHK